MFDPFSLAMPGVASLKPYEPGKPEEELKRELNLDHIIKLASNENPLGCSKKATRALRESSNIARYPDGSAFRLKQALAEKLNVNSAQFTIGNGSNDILELLVKAFVSNNDTVVISQHAFAVYYLASKAVDANITMVPANKWGHDLDAMLAACNENAKMVFIANPNNPTGTYHSQDAIVNFLRQLPATIIAVIDEAYIEYVTAQDYGSMLEFLHEFPNLVITRTFSKAYGLAGLRIGYGICSEQIADLLNRVRQPFNANMPAQNAAIEALNDNEFVSQSVALNSQQKQSLYQGFAELGLDYIESQGNFVCVCVDDEQGVYQNMLNQGIIVRPIGNYQMPGWLRFTIGLADENQQALVALKNSL